MPVLIVLFLLNAHNNLSLERRYLVIAFLFSWFGDLLLMQNRNDLFLFGLVSFLLAHISYIIAFMVRIQHAYIALMLYILSPKLNTNTEETKGLLVPVVLYTFVVVGMTYTSYLRDREAPGFWTVFVGAVFFVLSDSLIALNRFVMPLPTPGLFIMFTYGLGQYLITVGSLQVADKNVKIC
ncbi:unnamed protein product [Rotaria magnacalcarata]|uniref:lysoplasmalogenase n=2 Tax=Rotaria magnacalcarata TaxID=392030 RepID=A0A816CE74_9BILA|nr:unnamed protein product [Rotaria magnacalcarata]CAF1620431.1 unnamed protein product [Rotaria magnacalcarata]